MRRADVSSLRGLGRVGRFCSARALACRGFIDRRRSRADYLVIDYGNAGPGNSNGNGTADQPQENETESPEHHLSVERRTVACNQSRIKRALNGLTKLLPPVVSGVMASVFVIEDDHNIRELATRALASAGHVVRSEATGMTGLQGVIDSAPDVVILDLGLPDVDGGDVLRMLRAVSEVPVIIATARDEDAEIVRLLDAGADEYVVKPFSGAELEARVRALMRRVEMGGQSRLLTIGGISIDHKARSITLDGNPISCNRKEFDLLAYLVAHNGRVVPREELYAEVWREPYGGADKTIDVHLSWLRRKLGETAAEPRYLHTIRGVGVKIVDPR